MARKTTKSVSYTQRTLGVVGWRARIRNTRIPVWSLVEMRALGASDRKILEAYPSLTLADLEAAWRYYEANHPEIDFDIKDQDIEDEALA